MIDFSKPGDGDQDEPGKQQPSTPEFGSPFDYDATADASMTESTTGTSSVPPSGGQSAGPGWDTYSGTGNGPGWGSGPSYPPPTGPVFGTPQPEYSQHQPEYTQPTPPPYPEQPPYPATPPPYTGGYPVGYGFADPTAPFGRDPITGEPYSDKTKVAAGLLQIFLGAFGAGRFYTGHTGVAIAQILVTWLTCGIGAVWPVIDGIVMLAGTVRDAQGRKLRP